jgi:imidazolonepropionase-like amidohydrolase
VILGIVAAIGVAGLAGYTKGCWDTDQSARVHQLERDVAQAQLDRESERKAKDEALRQARAAVTIADAATTRAEQEAATRETQQGLIDEYERKLAEAPAVDGCKLGADDVGRLDRLRRGAAPAAPGSPDTPGASVGPGHVR